MFRRCAAIVAAALIAACASEADDWAKAVDANTAEACEAYLERHPDGAHRDEAASRLHRLREERDFEAASAKRTEEAWESFLARHPGSQLTSRAEERLAELRAWSACESSDEPSAIRAFLEAHPAGSYVADANARLAELADLEAARQSDTIEAYREFLEKHPSSRAAPDVEDRAKALESVREERGKIGLWQDVIWASSVEDAPTCRIKLLTNERGRQVVSSIGGGYWEMAQVFALGSGGRFDGQIREVPRKMTLFGNGSRWVLVGTNQFYRGGGPTYAIESDNAYPALMAWDAKGGLMYVAGRVVVRPVAGDPIRLGQDHTVETMLPLLSSRVPVLREAAAWAVGWLAQEKEARRKAVNALLPLFDDPDPLVRITVVEAVGRAGDAQDLAPLVRMRNGIPEKPGIRPGPIPDPSAETELRAAVEWAILAIQGRIAGKRAKGACGKCSTPGCTVDHG